jgi:ribosome recycling factor
MSEPDSSAQAKQVMVESRHRMERSIDTLDEELGGLRTGRASPALVERLPVDIYGTAMPLKQLATIATPEPRMITIRAWDPKSVQAIEKAIMASDLGMTPSSDGTTIRLIVPRLTEERRDELTKMAAKRVEEARIAVRNIRRDAVQHLEKLELREDEEHRLKEQVQELTDEFVALAEEHGERKSAEIHEV